MGAVSFAGKGFGYNLGAEGALASATLTDCDGSAPLLFVVHAGIEDSGRYLQEVLN